MIGFFKPMHRKLGAVMLVLACVFATGWVRSCNTHDYVVFWSGKHTRQSVSSIGRCLRWSTFFEKLEGEDEYLEEELKPIQWSSESIDASLDITVLTTGREGEIQWQWLGFCLMEESISENCRDSHFFIPYWSIVVPLTLLSSWLLLSNLKRSKLMAEEAAHSGQTRSDEVD